MEKSRVTDPAEEIANLIDHLRTAPTSDAPTYEALAQLFGVAPGSPEFLEILSAVRSRLGRLNSLVSLPEVDIRPDVAALLQQVISRFANVVSPLHLHESWSSSLANWVSPADATQFRIFSALMIRYVPLARFTADEASTALEQISAAEQALTNDGGLDEWSGRAIKIGFARLRLVISHFIYFGHDLVREELALASIAFQTVALKQQRPSSSLKQAIDTVSAIAALITLVTAPNELYHSYKEYSGLFVEHLSAERPVVPPSSSYNVIMIESSSTNIDSR